MFSYKKKYVSTSLTPDDIYKKAVESGRFYLSRCNKLKVANHYNKSHDTYKGMILNNLFKGIYVSICIYNDGDDIWIEFSLLKQLLMSIIAAAILLFVFMIFGYNLYLLSIAFMIFTFSVGFLRVVKTINRIIAKKI